jgi:DNA repair protein RecN (Recombination protein N)
MLAYLRIRGLALLEDVTLELGPGFNVLTGETGAGKSIIVGALSLLRGARAKSEAIRDGSEAAEIEAQFEPESHVAARIGAVLREHALPVDLADGVLVHRTVSKSGRGRTLVQSTLVTQHVLAAIGEALVDICSQHEHHFLTHTGRHLEVLDAFARVGDELAEHARRYGAWREAADELALLTQRTAERARRIDWLRFVVDELEAAAPQPGEHEALRKRVTLLRDAVRWAEFAGEAQALLYESDDAIVGRIGGLLERVRHGAAGSDELGAIEEQLVLAQVACEEAARAVVRFMDALVLDPAELEPLEDRLHELERLRRKHGVDVDTLAEHLATMRAELDELEHADEHLARLEARAATARREALASAAVLHDRRVAAARGLARAVETELAALHIPKARLAVDVATPDEADPDPGPHGIDRVEFLFSANAGEPLAPLRKVASGGELSRVLLALKGALAAEDRVATYVFDEVDAGVGGAVAEAIGRRLARAAAQHQVLCVTHLPQIAAFADAHYRVDKLEKRGRTLTQVVKLDEAGRVDELARMLGGAKVGASAREHAAALLEQARGPARPARAGRR